MKPYTILVGKQWHSAVLLSVTQQHCGTILKPTRSADIQRGACCGDWVLFWFLTSYPKATTVYSLWRRGRAWKLCALKFCAVLPGDSMKASVTEHGLQKQGLGSLCLSCWISQNLDFRGKKNISFLPASSIAFWHTTIDKGLKWNSLKLEILENDIYYTKRREYQRHGQEPSQDLWFIKWLLCLKSSFKSSRLRCQSKVYERSVLEFWHKTWTFTKWSVKVNWQIFITNCLECCEMLLLDQSACNLIFFFFF